MDVAVFSIVIDLMSMSIYQNDPSESMNEDESQPPGRRNVFLAWRRWFSALVLFYKESYGYRFHGGIPGKISWSHMFVFQVKVLIFVTQSKKTTPIPDTNCFVYATMIRLAHSQTHFISTAWVRLFYSGRENKFVSGTKNAIPLRQRFPASLFGYKNTKCALNEIRIRTNIYD